MGKRVEGRLAVACFAAIAASCFWQLFVPPQIGVANNGDFAKVAGDYRLAPAAGWGMDEALYFVTDYSFRPQNEYHSKLPSSEHLFAWIAVKLSRLLISKETFSIHALTLVHLTFYLGVCAALLSVLYRLPGKVSRWAMPLSVLVLTDIAIVGYLPSFYMDIAALLFLLALAVSLLVYEVRPRPDRLAMVGVPLFGALLIVAKAQHAVLGLPLAVWIVYEAVRVRRWAWLGAAFILVALSGWMLTTPSEGYRAAALFSMSFYKIARASAQPAKDLAELGLGEEYLKYKGLYAYNAEAPVEDPEWRAEFLKKTGWTKIALFHLRHPLRASDFVWIDLKEWGWRHPDPGFGYRKREDGFAPRAQAAGPYPWRALRNLLMEKVPAHVFVLLFAGLFLRAIPGRSLVMLLTAMCGIELALATLADCLETARHLYLFQALLDLLFAYWICWLATRPWRNGSGREY